MSAQTADPEGLLRTELLGKQFVLLNMSAATQPRASWDGKVLQLDPAPWHELAVIKVKKVRVKSGEVQIEGDRQQLLRDPTDKLGLSPLVTPVTITLTGDVTSLAPMLPGALFYPNLTAAIAHVPRVFQKAIPAHTQFQKSSQVEVGCDCDDPDVSCRNTKSPGMKAPKVLSTVDPYFSEEARKKRIKGFVQTGILLDQAGTVTDVWIIQEFGYGLDQEAARSVSQYKFSPANCHGKPVSTAIYIDVNFSIF